MLRVIGGEAKGKKITILRGISVRPTAGRVKEALFNILGKEIVGAEVLDLFAGVGSLGIEALSRGAERAVFVDRGAACARIIRKNLARLDFHNRAEVYGEEADKTMRRLVRQGRKFNLVFLDPPYKSDLAEKTLGNLNASSLLEEKGTVAVEHHRKRTMPEEVGKLKLVREERYGDTSLSFYKV